MEEMYVGNEYTSKDFKKIFPNEDFYSLINNTRSTLSCSLRFKKDIFNQYGIELIPESLIHKHGPFDENSKVRRAIIPDEANIYVTANSIGVTQAQLEAEQNIFDNISLTTRIVRDYDGLFLKFVKNQEGNMDLYKSAINQNFKALKYIPHKYQKRELWEMAININANAIKYVKIKTFDKIKFAVKRDGMALKYIKPAYQRLDICKMAVEQNISALKYIANRKTKKEVICALSLNKEDEQNIKISKDSVIANSNTLTNDVEDVIELDGDNIKLNKNSIDDSKDEHQYDNDKYTVAGILPMSKDIVELENDDKTFTNYSYEESLIFNKETMERGKFKTKYCKPIYVNKSTLQDDIFMKPVTYDKLNDMGFYSEAEEPVMPDAETIIGKVTPMTDNFSAESTVVEIKWNISTKGFLMPTAIIIPVDISGIRITEVTLFNAKFVRDNKIGKGTKIIIWKVGEIIPFVRRILSPSLSGEEDMPLIPYVWNEEGNNILQKDTSSDFCKKIHIDWFKI